MNSAEHEKMIAALSELNAALIEFNNTAKNIKPSRGHEQDTIGTAKVSGLADQIETGAVKLRLELKRISINNGG